MLRIETAKVCLSLCWSQPAKRKLGVLKSIIRNTSDNDHARGSWPPTGYKHFGGSKQQPSQDAPF